MIEFLSENIEMPELDKATTERWIRRVAGGYGFAVGEIHYIFCNDQRILEVNRQFLGHDYFTDIITFDYSTAGTVNGDIYISLDTVRSNALEYDKEDADGYMHELNRVIIHGVLHLTGQGDKTPESAAVMREKENKALDELKKIIQ